MSSASDDSLHEIPEHETLQSSLGASVEISTRHRKRTREIAAVWQYFQKSNNGNSSTCQINISENRICNFSLKGNNSTNLENHLKYKHPEIFKDLLKIKKQKKEEKAKSVIEPDRQQLTLEESMARKESVSKKYNNTHPTQIDASRKLTKLLAATSMPYQMVQLEEFKDFVYSLDSRYSLPNRKKASQMVAMLKKTSKIAS